MGRVMGEWKANGAKFSGLVLALVLAGCGAAKVEVQEKVPVLVLDCPDPDERRRLGPGDTYRDLAVAHANAVAGWSRCHSAAKLNGDTATGE